MPWRSRAAEIRAFKNLLTQAHQGSTEAWERLYQMVENAARGWIIRSKPRNARGLPRDSDLVQEVATKVSQDLPKFRGKTPQEFIVWVTVMTQNLITDFYRHYQSRVRSAGKEVSLESLEQSGKRLPSRPDNVDVGDEEKIAQARKAVAQLPKPYQQVIELRINEELTFEEIAERLNCTEDAARMMFHRAVHIAREIVKEPS